METNKIQSMTQYSSCLRQLMDHILFTGGGVLAHTILGVDFNDQTGDIRWVQYV